MLDGHDLRNNFTFLTIFPQSLALQSLREKTAVAFQQVSGENNQDLKLINFIQSRMSSLNNLQGNLYQMNSQVETIPFKVVSLHIL